MKLQPVSTYRTAGYPTRPALDAHPELLRVVPIRWQGCAAVMGVLVAVYGLSAGVTARADDPALATPATSTPAATSPAPIPSDVAPIFLHGNGVVSFGGEPDANNNLFLTEDDMRQIVVDECKAAGINFKPDVITLKDLPMPEYWDAHQDPNDVLKINETLDGTDADKHISYEVVSRDDMEMWGEVRRTYGTSFDSLSTARVLRDSLIAAKVEGDVGVFYDPLIKGQDAAKDALRQQVKDFIAWLKTEGAI